MNASPALVWTCRVLLVAVGAFAVLLAASPVALVIGLLIFTVAIASFWRPRLAINGMLGVTALILALYVLDEMMRPQL